MSLLSPPAPATAPLEQPNRRMPRGSTSLIWVLVSLLAVFLAEYLTGAVDLTSTNTVQNGLLRALPILLAGLGGVWAERSGVINIGLEGMMIFGTWGAAWGGYFAGPWIGLLAAAVFGALGGLLHAVATVTFGVNHIVSGVALNLLGQGVTKYLSTLIFQPISNNPRESPLVPKFDTYSSVGIGPWLERLEQKNWFGISDLAGIVHGLITGVSPLTMLCLALVPITYLVLWRSRFGLRLRSCGENPVAAESLGVRVYLHKYVAVIASGALAGIGGATLVLNRGGSGYLEGQTDGRGYIGLAAMIFGNWKPGGLLAGSALFGYTDGLQLTTGPKIVMALVYGVVLLIGAIAVWKLLQRKWLACVIAGACAGLLYWFYWAVDEIPSELLPYTPHFVTLAVLAVSAQRLRMPAADGFIYQRGRGG
ncbi:ABC transporter permease [Sciscionella marina]|uniref:ABC transporter permease n=1 Tax=Sciscionella marina TaxID=508770 RepID=UPI000475EFB9|nr:ABC transporter permease [Sciscionella marina]